jgi:hypothetical protein
MITLLNVVKQINAGKIEDDIAPLFGGSREVNQVYTSFAKLYKIVRVSNSAFFSRNLRWACHFVRDALNLFTKIEDRKAIAIASGNLGSTLLAINCSRTSESRCSCLVVDSICCVKEAFSHFETAVVSGTEDFQTAADMTKKVEFGEQLSDRLFNRGLYFLLSKDDPCAESDFEALGLQDLVKVQALDLDILDYWIQNGLLQFKSSTLFDRLLRRLHGLCSLMENGISQGVWDPKSLAYDCHRILSAAWDNPEDPLFADFTRIGRLQQLEGALINLQLQTHQLVDATRIAMRMLVEDEFINDGAFQYAADAVLQFTVSPGAQAEFSWTQPSVASARRDIHSMLKCSKQANVHTQKKCVFLCMELHEARHLANPALQHHILALYDSNCVAEEDFFGMVASPGRSVVTTSSKNNTIEIDLECKQERHVQQRQSIEFGLAALAQGTRISGGTSSSSLDFRILLNKAPPTCKALAMALDKVMESGPSSVYDSYIVYVTDGPKRLWDWKALESMKSRIGEINAKRKGDIHLVVLDLEEVSTEPVVDEEEGSGDNAAHVARCRTICKVSEGSAYIPASLSSLEDDFSALRSSLWSGNRGGSCSNALLSGITMEKF